MKHISTLLFLIALYSGTDAFAQKGWYQQQTGPVTDTVWNSVGLIDAQTGTIVGQNGLMLRTTNGGGVWSYVNTTTTQTLFKIRWYDSMLGFAVGNNGVIIKTADGGASWTTVNSGTTKSIYDIYAKSPTEFIVVGNGGLLRRTTNAGAAWIDDSGGGNNLWSIAFAPNKLLGITVGNSNTEYATTDGGKNWTGIDIKASSGVNGVAFLNDSTIVVVGVAGTIIYTTNKGKTWKQGMANVPLSTYQLTDVCAAGPNMAFAVGWAGMIIVTVDGGKNWTAQDATVGYHLQGISFVSNKIGVACGWRNTVVRTTTGGSLAAGPIAALPSRPALDQNYPNPFRGDTPTSISFTLPSSAQTTLKVYNTLGVEVAVLRDGFETAGQHRILWNAGSITPGVYYYTLTAGEYSVTKQLVFIK